MTEIKGIIAAMQTAMHEDGSINEVELRRQINRQIDAGVDAVFCLGTNGEFYIMSAEEKIRVMEIFVDEVKGRVPVYAGTGCISTEETVALSRKAQEIGVDVLSVITPYFAAISQEELPALRPGGAGGGPSGGNVQHPGQNRCVPGSGHREAPGGRI